MNLNKGYSLVEMLVVLAIFSVLGIIVAQTILLTARNVKKSENTIRVREEIDHVVGVMERQLRNARAITNCSASTITYTDVNNTPNVNFSCQNQAIRWKGSNITSGNLTIANCSIFTCSSPVDPDTITVNITAISGPDSSIEVGEIDVRTEINPRNYLEQ